MTHFILLAQEVAGLGFQSFEPPSTRTVSPVIQRAGRFGIGMRLRAFLGQEHRDVPDKPFRILVLRAVIGVQVEDQLGVGDVLLPGSVVSRPLEGDVPTIDLAIGYSKANTSPTLKLFLSRVDELIVRGAQKAH